MFIVKRIENNGDEPGVPSDAIAIFTELSRKNRSLAIKMINKKLNIYLQGLIKRRKNIEAEQVKEKIKFWKKNLIEY